MTNKLHSNDVCWCGSGRKYKRCHKKPDDIRAVGRVLPGRVSPLRPVPGSIPRPPYLLDGRGGVPAPREGYEVHDAQGQERMRVVGRAAAAVLAEAAAHVAPGITTDDLDAIVHEACIALGGYPSPLGYAPAGATPFPKSVCTSVNEVICHGIPDDRPLEDGDIVNLDVTLFLDGYHGDTNATFPVGRIDAASAALLRVTEECLGVGIGQVRPGAPVRAIGQAIQDHAHRHGMSVVRAFVGHGVGRQFHAAPTVFHYPEPRATDVMEPGMTFTIEPMIALGTGQHLLWPDGWTAVTADQKRTAQYEHTLLVTDDGVQVLTAAPA